MAHRKVYHPSNIRRHKLCESVGEPRRRVMQVVGSHAGVPV